MHGIVASQVYIYIYIIQTPKIEEISCENLLFESVPGFEHPTGSNRRWPTSPGKTNRRYYLGQPRLFPSPSPLLSPPSSLLPPPSPLLSPLSSLLPPPSSLLFSPLLFSPLLSSPLLSPLPSPLSPLPSPLSPLPSLLSPLLSPLLSSLLY